MSKILIADDEIDVRELVAFNLQKEGYDVTEAANGLEALKLADDKPDLIVLDLMMPQMDGFEVFRRLRKNSDTQGIPIIMLTARGGVEDRIEGLGLGADDYVSKPFSPKELTLRVRNLLQRSQNQSGGTILEAGPFRMDRGAIQFFLEGEQVELTSTEFKLLMILVENRGEPQERGEILRRVWGYDERIQTRTLDTHVKRLREKLDGWSDAVQTIRGIGYCFQLPADVA